MSANVQTQESWWWDDAGADAEPIELTSCFWWSSLDNVQASDDGNKIVVGNNPPEISFRTNSLKYKLARKSDNQRSTMVYVEYF